MHTEDGFGTYATKPPLYHLGLPNFMPLNDMLVTNTITPPATNVNEPSDQHTIEQALNALDEPTIF